MSAASSPYFAQLFSWIIKMYWFYRYDKAVYESLILIIEIESLIFQKGHLNRYILIDFFV